MVFPWLTQVNYSKNHDFLRTVGFIAVLLAVSWMYWVVRVCHASSLHPNIDRQNGESMFPVTMLDPDKVVLIDPM